MATREVAFNFNNTYLEDPAGNMPDEFILADDLLLSDADRQRMNSADMEDPLSLYYGYPHIQADMIAREKAWRRLQVEAVTSASERLAGFTKVTSLNYAPLLSTKTGNDILLKCENEQPTKSFKIRGAFNKIAQLSDEERQRGIVTLSAGNHAQGAAVSAQHFNAPFTVLMPTSTPDVKVNATKERGANVVLVGENFSETEAHYYDNPEKYPGTFIHPFDDEDVINGQGTVGLEILTQRPDVTHIFVPVGGGGLVAGIAKFVKNTNPDVAIFGVESAKSASMQAALHAGRPVELNEVDTFADGVAVKRVGQKTLEYAQLYIDGIITVETPELCLAMQDFSDETGSQLEPAGALAIAGAKKFTREQRLTGQTFAAICSGGNVSKEKLNFANQTVRQLTESALSY